jgi:hypothetical protein
LFWAIAGWQSSVTPANSALQILRCRPRAMMVPSTEIPLSILSTIDGSG